MDVLDFTVLKKKIECDVKQVVGDNDYQASFMFDEEWDDKEVICRVIWNNKTSLDITLEDYSCVIPAYFVKTGEISVGVYVDGEENLATTPWKLGVLKSVKESVYGTAVPHKEVWDEINEKVADMVTNSEFDAKVNELLAEESSDTSLWEFGTISNTTGSGFSNDSTTRIRTKDYIPSDVNKVYLSDVENYVMTILAYDIDGNFVGAYYKGDFVNTGSVSLLTEFEIPKDLDYKYKIAFRNTTATTEITINETENVIFVYSAIDKLKNNIVSANENIKELSEKVNSMETPDTSDKINLIRFAYTDIGLKSRELHVDGKYLYIGCFAGKLLKMDFGIESNPTVEWQITLDPVNNINGIACDDNYLYVVDRDPKAWDDRTDGSTIGHLYVINKTDGSVVNSIELSGKGSGIALYNHYALVSMQIYGWAIYDIADVNNITTVYEHLQTDYNKGEFQKIITIKLNNIPYMFIAGFDHGLTVWNISDITTPTLAHEFDLKAINLALYGAKKEQCFDMVKVDNYLYMPIAPLSAYLTDTSIRRGIIRLDLSDMTKMDNDEIDYYPISLDDWAPKYGESDTNPNAIVHIGNILLVNNAGLGLAMFMINDDYSLTYLKTVKVTTDGVVRGMVATSDGRLAITPDNSNGTDRVVAIYRPNGISY